MKELNKHILDEALQKLPMYSPKPLLWEQISVGLDEVVAQEAYDTTRKSLPVYSPPANLWDRIASELDTPVSAPESKPTPIISIRKKMYSRVIKYASVVVFAVTAGAYLFLNNSNTIEYTDSVHINYGQERVVLASYTPDWEEDEDAFQTVLSFCQEQSFVCERPDFRILKDELLELNHARESLKDALMRYGDDAELIAQLTQIEMERSDVLKKMISKI